MRAFYHWLYEEVKLGLVPNEELEKFIKRIDSRMAAMPSAPHARQSWEVIKGRMVTHMEEAMRVGVEGGGSPVLSVELG